MLFKRVILFLSLSISIFGVAQGQESNAAPPLLRDSLLRLGHTIYNDPNEAERLQANYLFIKTLVQLLKTPHSFDINLDTLQMIAIRKPADGKFRIFSWHLPLDDGSYRYYGAIQFHTTDGSLQLLPLVDHTPDIDKPEFASLDNEHWFGAQYYDLLKLDGLPDHYILLGWKATNPNLMQKVIEILWVKDQQVHFGKALFAGRGVGQQVQRMIYRYNRQASMLLKFDSKRKRILMDHLAASDPQFRGDYSTYGPDMSYDAWEIRSGKLVLTEDLLLQNEEKD